MKVCSENLISENERVLRNMLTAVYYTFLAKKRLHSSIGKYLYSTIEFEKASLRLHHISCERFRENATTSQA